MFTADELPLDEHLPVEGLQQVDIEIREFLGGLQPLHLLAEGGFDIRPHGVVGAGRKWKLSEIAGQADAAGDDDVRVGTRAAQPLTARVCEGFQIHRRSPE